MFFSLSKVLWFIADPVNLLFLALLFCGILTWTRWRSLTRWWITLTVLSATVVAVIPIGEFLFSKLENRFPRKIELPVKIEGILVLGGVVDQFISEDRGVVAINGAVERLTAFARLSKRYPEARLVFTGGSGVLSSQNLKEAHYIKPLIRQLGIDPGEVFFEDQSRNTLENAVLTKKVVQPSGKGWWIIITSAFHMPRAMGVFRQAGWKAIPYPVDYHTVSTGWKGITFDFSGGIGGLSKGLHEWIGLTFYWLTGRTNVFFPGPESTPHGRDSKL